MRAILFLFTTDLYYRRRACQTGGSVCRKENERPQLINVLCVELY